MRRFPRMLRRAFPPSLSHGFAATIQEMGDVVISSEAGAQPFRATIAQACDICTATVSPAPDLPTTGWQPITPGGGGGIVCLEPCKADTTGLIWYLATDISGAFRSTDGGETWKDITAGIRNSTGCMKGVIGNRNVLASDPTNVNRLYYAFHPMGCLSNNTYNHDGVWRSDDKGNTWTELTSNAAKEISRGGGIICDNSGGLYGFKSNSRDMHYSENQGAIFVGRDAPITARSGDHDGPAGCGTLSGGFGAMILTCAPNNRIFYADPTRNTNLILGGVYYTDSTGQAWTRITSLNGILTPIDIACHPTNSNRVLACLRDPSNNRVQIWVSSDNGTTFAREPSIDLASNPPGESARGGIAIDRSGVAICHPATGRFSGARPDARSMSSGDIGTWVTYVPVKATGGNYVYKTNATPATIEFKCHPQVTSRWISVNIANVALSKDANASTYREYGKGIAIQAQSSLVVDRTNPDLIFHGSRDIGMCRSTNRGGIWTNIDASHGYDSYGLCQDPVTSTLWYRVRGDPDDRPNCVFEQSLDNGITWTPRSNPPQMAFPQPGPQQVSIIVDPNDTQIIYAAWAGGGSGTTLISFNRGASFTAVPNAQKMENVIRRGRNLYGYTGNGVSGGGNKLVRYNMDSSVYTNLRATGASVCGFDIHPTNAQIMWVCEGTVNRVLSGSSTKGVLLKSSNGGGSWTPVLSSGGKNFSPSKVYIDPNSPNIMLMAGYLEDPDGTFHGLQFSSNAGLNWSDYSSPLPIQQLTINFVYGGVPGRVYASTSLCGCYVINGLY